MNCRFSLSMNGDATILSATGANNNPSASLGSLSAGGSLTLGTGSGQVNELFGYVLSIPKNSAQTLILSNGLTDIGNQLNVSIARLRAICIELRAPAQDSAGTNAVSVTLNGGGVNPWTSVFSGNYNINNGGWWAHGDMISPTGMLVAAGNDHLVITNNDNAVSATVRATFYGSTS